MTDIVLATTLHNRYIGKSHAFQYVVPYIFTTVDALEQDPTPFLFSVNSPNVFTINSNRYFKRSSQTLSQKISDAERQLGAPAGHRWLLTTPQFFGVGFNPVSFYFKLDATQQIESMIAEVTNTYGEKHIYWVFGESGSGVLDCVSQKVFHVSPFLSEAGQYRFRVVRASQQIEIHIWYVEDGKTVFYANLIEKERFKMSTSSLIRLAVTYPLGIVGIFPRILKQATVLHYQKNIPARAKPSPQSADTIRHIPPPLVDRLMMNLVFGELRKFEWGKLAVELPTGEVFTFGGYDGPDAKLVVTDFGLFKTLVFRGELGFGEAYVDGIWTTPDLNAVLTVFLKNKVRLKRAVRGHSIVKSISKFGHFLRRNTLQNSRKNIQAHYDLSNEMYALFLDNGMNYSSAVYANPNMSLEDAQFEKLDRLINGLSVQSHHHVLEIGSGWGAAAIRLAQRTGCRVTTLTLSQAQHDEVVKKIQSLGLSGQVQVRLEDYRAHVGRYDRVLSIEMIEAVGHQYLGTYFQAIDRFLKPNGVAAIQAITVPDQRYELYKSRVDWIQRHIFPGGHLPSLSVIQRHLLTKTGLVIESCDNIGPDYAVTLAEWRQRFLANESKVRALGFDTEFIRKWVYYLTYCETGFAQRYINTLQLILTRPMNDDLISGDATRFRKDQ